jgi:hypothetical protein
MTKVMLSCGHAANSTNQHGEPSCAICAGVCESTPITPPDLTGRMARCTCGRTEPSTLDGSLAFFEFCGEGSPRATDICVCHYASCAHDPAYMARNVPNNRKTVIEQGKCSGFRPQGAREFDSYYCGCRGWN